MAPVIFLGSVCHFDHSEADHLVVQHKAFLEDLNDLVLSLFLVFHMHHGVVKIGISLTPSFSSVVSNWAMIISTPLR